MALLTDISKRLHEFFNPPVTSPVPQKKQIKVQRNFVSEFGNSPVGKAITSFQKGIENKTLPKVNLTQYSDRIQNPVGRTAAGFATGIGQDLVNIPQRLLEGGGRVGTQIVRPLQEGRRINPYEALGATASVAEPLFDLYSFGGGKLFTSAAKKGIKTAGKETFKRAVLKGAGTGAAYGGTFGGLRGLSEGNQADLTKGFTGFAQGAALGGVFGAGTSVLGRGIGNIRNAVKRTHPNATEQEVNKLTREYARDRAGKFAGINRTEFAGPVQSTSKNYKVNHWMDKVDDELGIPKNMQEGKISFGAKVGGKTEKVSKELKKVLTNESNVKERGFITTLKESGKTPNRVKKIIEGTYVPKSGKELRAEAQAIIKRDPVLAEQLATNPTSDVHVQLGDELMAYYNKVGQFGKAKALGEKMAESGTEFGRAVQAYANYNKTTPTGALRFAQQTINKYNKLNPNKKIQLTDKQVKAFFAKANKIQQMPEGKARNIASHQLMDDINNLIPSSIGDKAVAVWKAGLLTSLRTHERNILGNSMQFGAETAKDIIASPVDKLLALRTGKRSLTFSTKGIGSGGKEGLRSAKDIIQTGFDPEEAINKYDYRHITWGKGKFEQGLKKYTDTVFRTLGAEDKVFWHSAYARSMYDQAGAVAINAGKKGNKNFIEKLVKSPTTEMIVNATKDANKATFKDETMLREIAAAFKRSASKNEFTKVASEVIAPFTGVPSSIAKNVVEYSPIGLLKGVATAGKVLAKNVPSLQRQAAQEIGRGVVGSGLFGIGAYLTSKGLMTGQPKDTAEREQWRLENKPSNSVLIGGKWRNINSIGPQLLVTLAGAKAQEELQNPEGSLTKFAPAVLKDFLSQTFLQGVQGPLQAVNEPERFAKSYIGNQISSTIPNIIKDSAKALDNTQRENNTVLDYSKNNIPVLRNSSLPFRDVLGTPVPQEPTGVNAFFDLFSSKTPTSNIVVDELQRLSQAGFEGTPGRMSKTITIDGEKTKLTPGQMDNYEKQAGINIQNYLQELFSSDTYKNLNDEQKQEAVDSAVRDARKDTREMIDFKSSTQGSLIKKADAERQAASGKVFKFIDENGKFKTIDITEPIEPPQLTGSKVADKELMSTYKSKISSRVNDIRKLYELGKITQEEFVSMLEELDAQTKSTSGGSGGKKRTKLSLPTPKALPALQFSKSKLYKAPKFSSKAPKLPNLNFAIKPSGTKFAAPSKERLAIRTSKA